MAPWFCPTNVTAIFGVKNQILALILVMILRLTKMLKVLKKVVFGRRLDPWMPLGLGVLGNR